MSSPSPVLLSPPTVAQARRARRTGIVLLGGAAGLAGLLVLAAWPPSPAPDAPAPRAAASTRAALPDSHAVGGALAPALLPPLTGYVSRGFLPDIDHWGVDLAVAEGTAVGAPADGVVILADETDKGGHTVVLQHTGGLTTVFKHNARLLVRAGERVRAGSLVALSGNTGEWTSGPHLHYEVWQDGEPVDPAPFLAPW